MSNMIHYRPMGALDLLGDFSRALDSFFQETPASKSKVPAVNVREEEKCYILEAELPGMSQDDVDVKVEDNLLTISTSTKKTTKEEKGGYLLRERVETSFSRSFVLPQNVDRQAISAKFKNGLLVLEMQKKEKDKTRSIEVKIE